MERQLDQAGMPYMLDDNMNITPTECITEKVKVKSSAHVSHIVGKQGSKIRQIRQETGTLIQTPVNGEDPIFTVSGHPSQVKKARMILEAAAKEFDFNIFIEACTFKDGEKIQNNLYLPPRFIGLVVGKKGLNVKRIMESTGATIVTPKVNTLNAFKIIGNSSQIRSAIDAIKNHLITTSLVKINETRQNDHEIILDIE